MRPTLDLALLADTLRAARTAPIAPPPPGQRLVVLGNSGVGKSTLAAELARRLELDHIELDAEFWLPGWQERSRDALRERVRERLDAPGWVVDGNYGSKVRDLVWPRADTVIWIDYALPRVLWQVTTRTARRVARRDLLWGTNRESLRKALSRDSIILWSLSTWARHRLDYTEQLSAPRDGLNLVQLRTPAQTAHWLAARTAPST